MTSKRNVDFDVGWVLKYHLEPQKHLFLITFIHFVTTNQLILSFHQTMTQVSGQNGIEKKGGQMFDDDAAFF